MNKINIVLDLIKKLHPFANIEPSTELIDSKIITSLDLFELVAEIELQFDTRIDEELISWENFVTVEEIANKVLKKVDL